MRLITRRTVYESRSDTFTLIPIGDVHLGNLHADERTLRQIVRRIEADEHAYWIGLGDYCEFINMRDPRFDPRELVGWLMNGESLADIGRAESARFAEILKPVAHRCLGLVEGNHEATILRHSETDVYSVIVEALADPQHEHRLDHRGMVMWRFTRAGGSTWTMTILASHGSGGGQSAGAVSNRLRNLVDMVDGVDLVLMGHMHAPDDRPFAKFRPGRNKVDIRTVRAVSIPALCGDMAYAESKDMRPVPTGWCEITIHPDAQRIESVKMNVGT